MSCPYFYPTESRGGRALLPLGDRWAGLCHTDPASPAEPQDSLRCNLGYARGQCTRFPDDAGPDAVRFTIARDDAAGVQLCYVVERDHHPFAHGLIDSGSAEATASLLRQQAAAYLESYRRRKGAA
jgi:hypothetical protein